MFHNFINYGYQSWIFWGVVLSYGLIICGTELWRGKCFDIKLVNEKILFILRGVRVSYFYTTASIFCFCVAVIVIFEIYYRENKVPSEQVFVGLMVSAVSAWFVEAMHGSDKYSQREAAISSYSFAYVKCFGKLEDINNYDGENDVIKLTLQCLPTMIREIGILREKRMLLDEDENVHIDRIILHIENFFGILREIIQVNLKQVDITNAIFVHSVTSNIINDDVICYLKQQSIEVGIEYLIEKKNTNNQYSRQLSVFLARIYISMTWLDLTFREDVIVRKEIKYQLERENYLDEMSFELVKTISEAKQLFSDLVAGKKKIDYVKKKLEESRRSLLDKKKSIN